MKKITSIILYVLLAISVLSVIPAFIYGEDGIDYMLWWTYILLAVGVLSAIVMSIVNVGKNPGGAKTSLYGLAVVAVVLVVSYFLSDSTTPVPLSGGKKMYTDAFGLTLTDMGLYTTYFALIAAIVAVLIGEVRNSFK